MSAEARIHPHAIGTGHTGKMETLICKKCGTEKKVDPTQTVDGTPILDWWESVERLCKNCRPYTVEQFAAEFNATEITENDPAPAPTRKARTCSFCETPDTEIRLEWSLEMVWRHDRTLTDGSRTVDAKRAVDPPEYACQSCINLLRRRLVQTGPGLFG